MLRSIVTALACLLALNNAYAFSITATPQNVMPGDTVFITGTEKISLCFFPGFFNWLSVGDGLSAKLVISAYEKTLGSVNIVCYSEQGNGFTTTQISLVAGNPFSLTPSTFRPSPGATVTITPNKPLDGCSAMGENGAPWLKSAEFKQRSVILVVDGAAPNGGKIIVKCSDVTGVSASVVLSVVVSASTPAYITSQVINPDTSHLTLKLIVQPATSDLGKTGGFYLSASYKGQYFFYSNGTKTWELWHPGKSMAIWFTTTIQPFETQTAISNFNVSSLPGIQFWLGYGVSEADMVNNGKVFQVYPK